MRGLAGRAAARWAGLGGNLRGALLMTGNALVFSVMVALIKVSAQDVPLAVVMFFSVATQFAFVSLRSVRGFGRSLIAGERRGLHLLRVLLLVASMYAGFSAVVLLPMAEATAISFSKAFFVTIFAAILLGEAVGSRRCLAIVVGFAGILILVRPGEGDVSVAGAVIALVSASTAAAGAIATRVLAQRDPSSMLLLYQAALGTVVIAPLAIWEWRTPDLPVALCLVLIGLLSVLGNALMIMALRAGEASALAPVDFTRAVFATAVGVAFLGEVPTLWALAGTMVVTIGALLSIRTRPRQCMPLKETQDEL